MKNSLKRWMPMLRYKAEEYEHVARKNGDIVASPSIDDICNEMMAFIDGYNMGRDNK
jgi:hypothetical protein